MENQPYYKGFAYINSKKKPYIVFGNSAEEIITKLNGYNNARKEEDRFRYCNIGQLNKEDNKYTDYHKYDMSGRDISNIYLNIPPMDKDGFIQLTNQLKENGARYNPYKKRWYIEANNDNPFFSQYQETGMDENVQDEAYETPDIYQAEDGNTIPDFKLIPRIAIEYADGRPADFIDLSPGEYNLNNTEEIVNQIYKKIENRSEEPRDEETQIDTADTKENLYSQDENRITIYSDNGLEPIEISGEMYGLQFQNMNREEIKDFVTQISNNNETPDEIKTNYKVGQKVDLYVLQEKNFNNYKTPEVYHCDQDHLDLSFRILPLNISGTITRVYDKGLELNTGSDIVNIPYHKLYNKAQTDVLYRAKGDSLLPHQFDLLAATSYSAGQMEEIRLAFKDGLPDESVWKLSDKTYSVGQMACFHSGYIHGLTDEKLMEIIGGENDYMKIHSDVMVAIEENRKKMHEEFQREGFSFDLGILKKIEMINGYTGCQNSLEQIAKYYREKTFAKSRPEIQKLVEAVGKECSNQELLRMKGINSVPER